LETWSVYLSQCAPVTIDSVIYYKNHSGTAHMVLEHCIQQHDFVTDSTHRYVYSVCVECCTNHVV